MEHKEEIVLTIPALQAEIDVYREEAEFSLENVNKGGEKAKDYLSDYNEDLSIIDVLEEFQISPNVLMNEGVQNRDLDRKAQ